MVREQLIIEGVNIPLAKALNPSITKSINDISEPQKKKSDFSKTITLPNSKELSKVFAFVFEINNDGTFNVNKKADALYLMDSQIILKGFLQLKSINITDTNDIEYSCVLFGETANFFTKIKSLELTDIKDLSDFNHFNEGGVKIDSWETQIKYLGNNIPYKDGRGYVYPLINYGYDNSLDHYDITDLKPSFFVKELFDRIFKDAGFTYTSSFLNSNTRFKKAIIPFVGSDSSLVSSSTTQRIFNAIEPHLVTPITAGGQSSLIKYIHELVDVGNNYDPISGDWLVAYSGNYNLDLSLKLTVEFTPIGNSLPVFANTNTRVMVMFEKYGSIGGSWTPFWYSTYLDVKPVGSINSGDTYITELNPSLNSQEYSGVNSISPNTVNLSAQNILLVAGDIIRVKLIVVNDMSQIFSDVAIFEDVNGVKYNHTVKINTIEGHFKNSARNITHSYGELIEMELAVPKKIKQLDFVLSIFKMFNLFVYKNPNKLNDFFIEPRDDFYNSEVVDWSEKLDVSKKLEILPMGLKNAKNYLFQYKKDKDYYNDSYLGNYGENYGTKDFILDNDFATNSNKTELIFSPTPIVGQVTNDRVVPTIIKADANGVVSRFQGNIRILIYGGLIPTTTLWTFGNVTLDKYPYCGHFDNPFNPTFDINFDLPKEIYYDSTYNTITLTDDNLYNRFWKKYIEEITDKNSKLVSGYFYLTPNDVSGLDFKKQYFFNNSYFRLHKLENYNPSDVSLTKCTFLKLKNKDAFIPSIGVVGGGVDVAIGSSKSPQVNTTNSGLVDGNSYNTKQAIIVGKSNIVSYGSKSINVQGNGNVISDQCKNVVINGNDNTVIAGVNNVQLINTSGVTVTESNTIYINGQGQGTSNILSIGKAHVIGVSNKYIVADTDSGLVEVELPTAYGNAGIEISFKNIGSNGILISVLAGQKIESNPTYTVNSSKSVTVFSSGQNWLIK